MMVKSLVGAAAVSAGLFAAPASAAVLLSENFNGATVGQDYGSALPGSVFHVTTGTVDVIGSAGPGAPLFSCVQNPVGNCLDLVGSRSTGGIGSNSTFNLVAGNTYTISFDGLLQGYSPGDPAFTTFNVTLGAFTSLQTSNASGSSYSLTYTPAVSQAGVSLGFATVIPGDSVHGVVLDNIVLSESPAVTGIPEPASLALLGAGMLGLTLRRRRV